MLFERRVRQAPRQRPDAPVPADGRDAPAEVLVHPLGPDAHLGGQVGVLGPERRRVYEDVFKIFADHRGFGDDPAVVVEGWDLAVGVDLLEPVGVLLERPGAQEAAGELEPLFAQRQEGLQRVGRGPEAVEVEHRRRRVRPWPWRAWAQARPPGPARAGSRRTSSSPPAAR